MTAILARQTVSSLSCPPRFSTRRRPERATFGHELAAVADRLAQPFMPWQRYVADVGCEVDPATGLPAYREVVVTVPRQQGKTTLFLSWQINRCNSARWSHPQRSVFTAQSGKDARDKWLDELFPLIRNSAIARLVSRKGKRLEINEGMGNESVRWATGSLIRLLSTSASSGHSKSIHQAVMDEIWHDADERREQGLRPAMITVPDAQLLVCSTAGTDASVILNRKVEAGRAATVADVGSGVAYFEWSAPDKWDPADEASYFTFMPALCPDPPCRCAPAGQRWRHTVTMDAIRSERAAMEPAEFARAYGNRKTSRMLQGVITEAQWRALQDPDSARVGDVALGADVDPLREFGSVAVFGLRADGLGHGHLVDYRPGVDWLPGRLAELREALNPIGLALGRGTYESLRDDLADVGLSVPEVAEEPCRGDVAVMTPMTMAAACGQMIDAVKQCSLRVRPSKPLDDAAAVGQVRQGADTVAWSPRVSGGQIGPIVSLTLARWLHGAWGELVAEADYDVLESFY
jgi:hypothetical protein